MSKRETGTYKECPVCGESFYVPKWCEKRIYCSNKCRYECPVYRKKQSETKLGILNGMYEKTTWNKGIGGENRALRDKERDYPRYKEWRKSVFERDDYTCRRCGIRGVKIEADHIKMWLSHPNLRYDVSNGQTLCKPCHKEKTSEELRKYWQNQYRRLVILAVPKPPIL